MTTINTIPDDNATFLTDLQTFLGYEIFEYSYIRSGGYVIAGGIHAAGAGLTATVSGVVACPNGFYTTETATAHTYTASTDTYVFVRYATTITPTIAGAVITYAGASSRYMFAEMANGAQEPAKPTGTLMLMKVVTDGTDITSVTDMRGGEVNVEGVIEATAATFSAVLASSTYVGSRTLTIHHHHRLTANTSVPASTHLRILKGAKISLGTYTLTISGPVEAGDYKWLDFDSTGNLDWNNGQPLRASWFADADGTDQSAALQEMITAAPLSSCEFVFPYTTTGFGIGTALVIPNTGSAAPLDWKFRGEGGKGKLITTAAVDVFQTYDVTVVQPTYPIYDLVFENLELDGNLTGTNGIRLHRSGRGTVIRDCIIHEFTNSQVYLAGCDHVEIDNPYFYGKSADPTATLYGIYVVSGEGPTITGGQIQHCQTGIHLDGNLTEAGVDVNVGPNDMSVTGTAITQCGQLGVHVAAGLRNRFRDVVVRYIGYNYAPAGYCIKVSNEGGQTPVGTTFDNCSFIDTSGVGDFALSLAHGTRTTIVNCCDPDLRGGTIAATATYSTIWSGRSGVSDLRPLAASNVTNSSPTTVWKDADVSTDERVSATTADATATAIWTLALVDNTAYVIEASVLAQQADGADRAAFQIKTVVFRTGAGAATMQGVNTDIAAAIADTGAAWIAYFDVLVNAVRLVVEGDAANSVHWLATLKYMSIVESV